MIKKIALALSFIALIISVSQAHEEEKKRLKPSEGDWGFTFNLSGIITDLKLNGNKDMIGNEILFFKHYLKDDLAIRLGLGINTTSVKTVRKDSVRQIPAFVEFDSTYSRNDWALSFGIEKHLDHLRRLDPYFGGELSLQFIGKEKSSWNTEQTESSGTTTIEGERKMDGGTGVGLFGIAGFNYFITERISLGGEYRFGYSYLKVGGNFSESEITTPPSGSVISYFNKGAAEERTSGLSVRSSANIVFSIFF